MNLYHSLLATILCVSSATAQTPQFECSPPQLIGITDGPQVPVGVTIVDDFVYIIDQHDGLVIADLSDPTNPRIISQTSFPLDSSCTAISINGPAAYLTCDDSIAVLNIEDKADPWLRRFFPVGFSFPQSPTPNSMTHIYAENYALNITRPLAPAPDPYADGTALDSDPIAIVGDELITQDLSRYNIINPLAPILTYQDLSTNRISQLTRYDPPYLIGDDENFAKFNLPAPNLAFQNLPISNVTDFTVRGDIAFVLNETLDIYTTGADARIIGSFDETELGFYPVLIQTFGDYFLMIGDGNLAIFAIPSNPISGTPTGGYQSYIEKIGDLVFLSSAQYAAKSVETSNIADVSDKLRPTWIAEMPFGMNTLPRYAASPLPGLIYATERSTGISIIDYTDPTNPLQTALYQTAPDGVNNQGPTGIDVLGDYAYVSDRFYGLIVYEINQDASLNRIADLDLPAPAIQIAVMDDIALVASAFNAYLVDISNPASPALLSTIPGESIELPRFTTAIRDGDLIYTSEYDHGYRIFDIAEPTAPIEVAHFEADVVTEKDGTFEAFVYDLLIEDSLLYVAMGSGGFAVYDNTDYMNPQLLDHIPVTNPQTGHNVRYRQFVKENDTVYIAAGEAGMRVLSLNGCSLPCAVDLNGDGDFNYFDVAFYIEAFLMNDPIADINSDGIFNFFDVFEFIASTQNGCP